MKSFRIAAIVDVVLIGIAFVFMVVMLFLGNNAGFFLGGTVLVVLILAGFILKYLYGKSKPVPEEPKEQPAADPERETEVKES